MSQFLNISLFPLSPSPLLSPTFCPLSPCSPLSSLQTHPVGSVSLESPDLCMSAFGGGRGHVGREEWGARGPGIKKVFGEVWWLKKKNGGLAEPCNPLTGTQSQQSEGLQRPAWAANHQRGRIEKGQGTCTHVHTHTHTHESHRLPPQVLRGAPVHSQCSVNVSPRLSFPLQLPPPSTSPFPHPYAPPTPTGG